MISPRLVLAVALAVPGLLNAAVVGTNPPAAPITKDRIATLPTSEQKPWRAYLDRSLKLRAADQAFFAAELKAHNITTPTTPPEGRGSALSLNRPAEWFASDEARKIADNVLSFQTPAGGWSKNMNFASHARQPGERFAPGNAAPPSAAAMNAKAPTVDNDAPADPSWHYVGTFDNDATITQLRFLARVATALGDKGGAPYRASFLRGLDYMFAAQFPNGGIPQVYPLEGGYHDAITINDNAMVNVLETFRDIASDDPNYAFVPAEARQRAATSLQRGVACLVACQIVVNGHRTAWCQQHDALTLKPASARNYEMPALSGSESDDVMIFLMSLPEPSPAVVAAVHAAAAWFEKVTIRGFAYRFVPNVGRSLVADEKAGPLWARYYEVGTDRPLFGDRDKSIHDKIEEISAERRNGYQWFNNGATKALERYAAWAPAHPAR
jgi:PelA/Pel-15E family pectate lyase